MSETLALIFISIIVAGFLILVGLAIWLAIERRRHLSQASAASPKAPPAARPPHPAPPRPEVARPTPAEPAKAKREAPAAPAAPATYKPSTDPNASAQYPGADTYDQTWLPDQPAQSKRPNHGGSR